jgi:tetratricopeptide (TPR) repeat protein
VWGGSAKDDVSEPAENTVGLWHEKLLQQATNANDAFGATYHARALRAAAAGDLRLARQSADAMVRFREFALAEEFYRAAINMAPADAELRHRLGHTFVLRGDLPGAAAVYRELTEIAPEFGDGFYSLGNTLRDQGDLRGAIEAFQNAVRVKPDFAEAHCNLGSVLQRRGFFAEALVELKRGHELGSARPDWKYPTAQWVAQAERFVTLEAQWLAIQRGEAKPANATDLIGLAQVCATKGHHLAAAQFYKDAIKRSPELAGDPVNGARYNAACAAVLTSSGFGNDADSLGADARREWRQLALEWLSADLNVWQSRLGAATPQVRASINAALAHWRQDTDLSVVRDAAAIANLSDD